MNLSIPCESNKVHLALIPWLKSYSRSRRNVQPEAAGRVSIEHEGGVHLEEMEMAAHLNRSIARVGHHDRLAFEIFVQNELTALGNNFSRYHHTLCSNG